jgi:hypothetical protein
VLELLTRYFVQHKKIAIPSVGSLQILHEPARYDVTEKRILPPGYRIEFREIYDADNRQVAFFSHELKTDEHAAENEMKAFGERFAKTIKNRPFEWSGIGEFFFEYNKINFRPEEYTALNAVSAPKVIHHGAKHMIRRGETEYTSAFEQQEAVIIHPKLKATTIGWILFLLAALFIIGWFFIHKSNPAATGLQL